MSATEVASHLGLIAVCGGTLSAGTYMFLDDLFLSLTEKQPLDLQKTLAKSAVMGCTGGLVISVLFYAFALYGWSHDRWTPSQLILIFALYVGLGHPLVGLIIRQIHNRAVTKKS